MKVLILKNKILKDRVFKDQFLRNQFLRDQFPKDRFLNHHLGTFFFKLLKDDSVNIPAWLLPARLSSIGFAALTFDPGTGIPDIADACCIIVAHGSSFWFWLLAPLSAASIGRVPSCRKP